MKHRLNNKQMIESVRRTFHETNQKMYQSTKDKQKINEDVVRNNRNNIAQSRVSNRIKES